MRENPNTNRQAAVEQLFSATGAKLVAMYGRSANGPGAMVIFDVTDPAPAPAITGVAVPAGTIQNVQLTRLFTMEEVTGLREKARQIRGGLRPTCRCRAHSPAFIAGIWGRKRGDHENGAGRCNASAADAALPTPPQ
jgi:hypothetical protein